MRWLFILVLALLVACVLSIIWMNDARRFPAGGQLQGGGLSDGAGQENPLTGQRPTPERPAGTP
ncbi:hypothetical protein [Neorhizobium sp. NCHU2750]|uniref:hypothetical protein n=1 Tax=Neorhizobium sp. NCHU2750 TaxID=1825976 RepID=UPI000EB673EE|nr:hypothetical protein NCHU2750_07210 [Neorhizobium sp. NCHU2750]